MLTQLSKLLIKHHKELLNNARVIGMWDLLLLLNKEDLIPPIESKVIRGCIKKLEKRYDTETN